MWTHLLTMDIGAPEKIVRTIVVYVGLAVLLRLAGKRDLAQLNSFDLVVMLLLSNVVQNAVIGPDNSLLGGLLGAAVLVAFNALMVRVSVRSDRAFRIMEGTPTVLARDGVWDTPTLRRLGLRQADVEAALRRQNANDISEVERVTLEPGGAVVSTVAEEYQSPTKGQLARISAARQVDERTIARLEAKIDELLARTAGS
jgi:uncharacterized membrane protein YcaP (DUF421 family)